MKTCETCGREYLDSYDACPFCERESRERRELLERQWEPPRRVSPALIAVVAGIASMAGIIIYIIVQVVLGSAAVDAGTVVAQKQACFLNQETVERAANLYAISGSGAPPARVSDLVGGFIDSAPECQAGGSYTWYRHERRLVCTVHGWHADPRTATQP